METNLDTIISFNCPNTGITNSNMHVSKKFPGWKIARASINRGNEHRPRISLFYISHNFTGSPCNRNVLTCTCPSTGWRGQGAAGRGRAEAAESPPCRRPRSSRRTRSLGPGDPRAAAGAAAARCHPPASRPADPGDAACPAERRGLPPPPPRSAGYRRRQLTRPRLRRARSGSLDHTTRTGSSPRCYLPSLRNATGELRSVVPELECKARARVHSSWFRGVDDTLWKRMYHVFLLLSLVS